jgi:selenocysteine-specific elongation factor
MKSIVVGTAGHIDHGKSALVLALTGTDPDRLKEEKARGITIDLGFAHTVVDDLHVAFVDVPGHERFVKNMLAGAGGIDLVVLVVAADESVMPQTREHFDICRLLRVPAGLVALTKADLADADTLELTRLEVRELVAGSFLDRAPIVPVSAKTGAGLDALRAALATEAAKVRGRRVDAVARLPIDRVFSMKGFGTVVTGTLGSGRVAVEDELAIEPGGRRVKVRGVQVHGASRQEAVAGQRAAVNLVGVEVDEIARGQNLVTPGAFAASRTLDGVIELLPSARPLKHGARVRFHQGTAEVLGRVSVVGGEAVQEPLRPGSRAFVRIRLEQPAIVGRGDRYILRAYSPPVTIAGGHIIDPHPPRSPIRTDAALARFRRLDFDPTHEPERAAAELAAAAVLIEESGAAGCPRAALVTRAAIDPRSLDERIGTLVHQKIAARAGDVLVARGVVDALEASLLETLRVHHAAQPLSEGVPREEARERLFRRGDQAVFDQTIEALVARKAIVARDRLALAEHRLELSPDEDRARAAIERTFKEAGLKPPEPSAAASLAGVPAPLADRMLKLLQRQKALVKLDSLLFHEQALKQLKADVGGMKSGEGERRIDVGMFKERFGVTRKFAIPLLEYLDRERVTRRVGDARVVL